VSAAVSLPGIYTIDEAAYHRDDLGIDAPMLSASIATILLRQSPLHAHAAHPKLGGFTPTESETFDLGTAAHALILEGSEANYAIIDANDWRTSAAKSDGGRARGARRCTNVRASVCGGEGDAVMTDRMTHGEAHGQRL
jgi:predicted Zn-dependent protease